MPYVKRLNGTINGLFNRLQPGTAEEYLPLSDLEVQAFLNPPPTALEIKKLADIAALGTRAELQAEVAAASSIPALRDLVLKLAEIVYSNEKNTID